MFFSLAIFLVLAGAVILMLKKVHRAWWQSRFVRRAVYATVILGVIGIVLRMVGMSHSSGSGRTPGVTIVGASIVGPASVLILMLFVSLPIAGVVRGVINLVGWLRRRGHPVAREATEKKAELGAAAASVAEPAAIAEEAAAPPAAKTAASPRLVGRRAVLEGVVAALPIATVGAGVFGIAGAYQRTRVAPLPMRFSALPPDLQGLKILQLTDLHLGAFLDLGNLETMLEDARARTPDLVVITGDFSDHLPWLASALSKVESLKPRLGCFGVFGNHEHYRGAAEAERIYGGSGVELLNDKHRSIRVGNTEIALVGVDDPARGGVDDFYDQAIDAALDGAPSDAWKLGLCHRPSGFPVLADRKIDLTLSGHTHGAQVGFGGRSILEGAVPEARLWGRYAIGAQQLYTSSGGGHWFAFRLNCPSEAPIVTLEQA